MTSPAPEYTDAEISEALNANPDAPYGLKADGTPKRGPGGRPAGKRARARSSRPAGKPAQAPPPASRPSTKRRSSGVDYRAGLVGFASIIALPLKFVSPADSMALMMHAGNIAEAVNETAKDRQEIAAVCDRLLSVGPYGLIIGALLPLGAQVCVNHGWLPAQVGAQLGAVPLEVLQAQAMETARQQEEQLRAAQEAMAAQETEPVAA